MQTLAELNEHLSNLSLMKLQRFDLHGNDPNPLMTEFFITNLASLTAIRDTLTTFDNELSALNNALDNHEEAIAKLQLSLQLNIGSIAKLDRTVSKLQSELDTDRTT